MAIEWDDEVKTPNSAPVKTIVWDDATPERGIVGRTWDALKVPEQKSREGLKMIANAIPDAKTSSVAANAVLNTPKLAVETLSEVAPGFVSRGSIVAGVGAKTIPSLVAPGLRWLGKTAESGSGLVYKTPGVLERATNDPKLIFAKGLEKARESYRTAKGISPEISDEFANIGDKTKLVEKAKEMAKAGGLSADEALEARKTLDSIKKSLTDLYYRNTRGLFDTIAKQKFGGSDKLFKRAIDAEALRTPFAINKSGTPSIVKGTLMKFAPITSALTSPLVQGAIATGIGAAKPILQNPQAMIAVENVRRRFSDSLSQ